MPPNGNMKFHGLTESLIDGTTTIKVLRLIIHLPQRQFTGRELASEAGTTPSKTLVSLVRLRKQGLVTVRQAGRAHQWQLNVGHALVEPLRAWFAFERTASEQVKERIVGTLGPLPFVRKAIIFGSFARREERPDSDVDLLVVVRDRSDKERAQTALSPVHRWLYDTFANPLRAIIYDVGEVEEKRDSPLLKNVQRDGWVVLERPDIKTAKVDRGRAGAYLRKAQEFADDARDALKAERWNAAGLSAVHAVISAADAATVHAFRVRSRETDHEQVYELLRRLPDEDALAKADQAVQVIERKNLIEYEARLFEEEEVRALVEKSLRFLTWVKKILSRRFD